MLANVKDDYSMKSWIFKNLQVGEGFTIPVSVGGLETSILHYVKVSPTQAFDFDDSELTKIEPNEFVIPREITVVYE